MPILRIQIVSFVRTWNSHNIRKQPNRPYLVPGKPFMNYNFPPTGVQNQGIQFDIELFKSLQEDVREWGMFFTSLYYLLLNFIIDENEYLPAETFNWTRTQLLELNFDPESPPSTAGDHILTPFRTIYLELRARTKTHIQQGFRPFLQLSQPPTGAFNWDPQINPNNKENLENVREVEVGYDQDPIEIQEN